MQPAVKLTTAETLAGLQSWHYHTYNSRDFAYQSCRFCHRSIHDVQGLWKYGVRHYACDECRDKIITEAGLARSGLYGTRRTSRILKADPTTQD